MLAMKYRFYKPEEAVVKAKIMLKDRGFIQTAKNKDGSSAYLVRMKQGKALAGRIRVSTHPTRFTDDLVHEIIFDYPTIENDIKTKVESAIKKVMVMR